jgi:osmotically-inducible protein OsmY
MKKQLFLLSSLCLALTACEVNNTTHTTTPNADNTARNVRDRGPTMTPGEQSETEADRTMTQKIRQALMDDDSLSTNAKNVKIMTVNGVVTLRGPVNSERERNEIGKKAKAVNGVKTVDNQIEIIRTDNTNPANAPR